MERIAKAENEAVLDKKAIFGWSMFDFANSSFTTVMVTAYFAIYFKNHLAPEGHGSSLWGLANFVSQMIVIAMAPLLGALADFSGSKKKFLLITYLGCCILTFSLGWVYPGQIVLGFTLFVLANIFYSSGENFIGAFLPEIAPQRLMGKISGLAWGLGYIGGIGSLIVSMLILGDNDDVSRYQYVWMMIAVWFFIAGIPTFLFVKERHQHEPMPPGHTIATVGFYRLWRTMKEGQRFRQLFRFLIVFMLISIGLMAAVAFASIIAEETLHFNSKGLGKFLVVTNLVAVVGAWSWGWLQDRIGSRWAIMLSLVNWLAALLLIMLIKPIGKDEAVSSSARIMFWAAGCFVGMGLGATQSSCRALIGIFSPEDRSGEFFGLWAFFGKLGNAFGPLVFGFTKDHFGMREAIALLGSFFIAAMIGMYFIDEREGRASAIRPPPPLPE